MEHIVFNTKILMLLIFAIMFTVFHLFAFFTFKHKVHTSRKSLYEYSRLINIQEREIEYKNIETAKFKGIDNLKKFISSANFEKINPARITYISMSDISSSGNKSISF